MIFSFLHSLVERATTVNVAASSTMLIPTGDSPRVMFRSDRVFLSSVVTWKRCRVLDVLIDTRVIDSWLISDSLPRNKSVATSEMLKVWFSA